MNTENIIAEQQKLLTSQQVAERLGLNEHTLAVWRTTKRYPELKYIKVGRSVRYGEADVEAFLKARTV